MSEFGERIPLPWKDMKAISATYTANLQARRPHTYASRRMNTIPFTDLRSQYLSLKQDILSRIDTVLEHGQYIMGPEVKEMEERLQITLAPSIA